MKKLLCTLVALTCVLNLTACGSSSDSSSNLETTTASAIASSESTSAATSKVDEVDEDINLSSICSWVTSKIWNDGFCNIYHYVESGKDAIGQEMDIEFTIDNLKIAYAKKDAYNDYIQSLDDSIPEQAQLINAWNKMNEQIDILYKKVTTELPRPADKTYEFKYSLFKQYFDTFYDLCFEIDDPVLKKTKNASGHTTSNTETMSAAAVTQTTTKPISEDSSNNKDVDLDDINVSRVNGDVILTMPSDIISSDEENSFEDILKNPHIKGVTDNGDGTVKVVIPESEYDALMNEIHAQFAESIKEIVQSEEYSTITDIKFNDEFTSFKIYVTDQQSFDDSTDSIVFLSLYLIAGYYAYFDGREVTEEDLEIRLFDANGNEFFEED